jgi:hypothetical protein
MVIRSNRGFGTLGVLDTSIWVGIVPDDLICGDGTLGFFGLVISSSSIDSKPLGFHLIVLGLSKGILIISMISGSFSNWSMTLCAPSSKRNSLLCATVVSISLISSLTLRAS